MTASTEATEAPDTTVATASADVTEPVYSTEPPAKKPDRHVHEADVVRVLTFACVIAVHTVSNTNANSSVSANALVMLLHFTREVFFCLTGFVLVHQYLDRVVSLSKFYRRRLVTVGGPYVAWSLLYTLLTERNSLNGSFAGEFGRNLLWGTAWYHIYFLLVSMQIYLLYPLLAKLIRRTAGYHAALLAFSGAVQLALLTWLHYWPPASSGIAWITTRKDILVVSYQFYVLVGAVAAFHLAELRAWVARRSAALIAFAIGSAAVSLTWYLLAIRAGRSPLDSSAVMQPATAVWSIGAAGALFLLGSVWARHRVAGSRADRAMKFGSDRSFGVFLIHPAVLWLVLEAGWIHRLASVPLTITAYVLTVAGSLIAVEVLRRSPVSLILTGRPPLRSPPSPRPKIQAASPEALPRKEVRHEGQFAGTA